MKHIFLALIYQGIFLAVLSSSGLSAKAFWFPLLWAIILMTRIHPVRSRFSPSASSKLTPLVIAVFVATHSLIAAVRFYDPSVSVYGPAEPLAKAISCFMLGISILLSKATQERLRIGQDFGGYSDKTKRGI